MARTKSQRESIRKRVQWKKAELQMLDLRLNRIDRLVFELDELELAEKQLNDRKAKPETVLTAALVGEMLRDVLRVGIPAAIEARNKQLTEEVKKLPK